LHIYGRRCSLQIAPHQLGHSYAALLFNTGVLILTVQAPLGHPCLPQGKCKFLDVTLGYAHICEGRVTSDHNRRVRISINLM
jgi:site-specific recombinase XerD